MSDTPFWEHPEVVERFASREPDKRLERVVARYDDPGATRVLDIGCAGGRNTEFLVRRGFDVHAVDAAVAMVAHTRSRVSRLVGAVESRERVTRGVMDNLSRFDDASFHLVVALGVFHSAQSREHWERTLAECARVLRDDGLALVANFTPKCDITGEGITPVPGTEHLYDGLPSGRHFLLEQDEHDAEFARFGFTPVEPSETVEVAMAPGRRVSVNALYQKGNG